MAWKDLIIKRINHDYTLCIYSMYFNPQTDDCRHIPWVPGEQAHFLLTGQEGHVAMIVTVLKLKGVTSDKS